MRGDGAALRPSRRQVLAGAGVATAVAATGVVSAAPSSSEQPFAGWRGLALDHDPVLHIIRRLTYGPTTALVQHVRQIGIDAFIAEQLQPELIPDPEGNRVVGAYSTLGMPNVVNHTIHVGNPGGPALELQAATVARAIWSERQLFEQMVEFWSNHFSIFGMHEQAVFLKTSDDRDVVRKHAMGKFADLLLASAQSPAMLTYLDNWISRAPDVNENYGRELLELHTLGVRGGYSENDIKNVAKVLSGWTVDPQTWEFAYRADWHVPGAVKVLGWRHPNATHDAGLEAGKSLIAYLARHPATARRIATKLATHFVSDRPPHRLVAELAAVYLQNDTAITPVLRHLFNSHAFRASSGQKYRRPMEFVAACVRALNLDFEGGSDSANQMLWRLRVMGQLPFGWRTPDGFPDTAAHWLSTAAALARWNSAEEISRWPYGMHDDPSSSADAAALPATAGAFVDQVTQRVVFQKLPAGDRSVLLRFLGKADNAPVDPAYVQERTPALAAVLINSPYLQVR